MCLRSAIIHSCLAVVIVWSQSDLQCAHQCAQNFASDVAKGAFQGICSSKPALEQCFLGCPDNSRILYGCKLSPTCTVVVSQFSQAALSGNVTFACESLEILAACLQPVMQYVDNSTLQGLNSAISAMKTLANFNAAPQTCQSRVANGLNSAQHSLSPASFMNNNRSATANPSKAGGADSVVQVGVATVNASSIQPASDASNASLSSPNYGFIMLLCFVYVIILSNFHM